MAGASEYDTNPADLHQFNSEHFTATTNFGHRTELMHGSWERRRLAGEWIGSLSCNQPARRRRSQEEAP